jgi:nucleosome binding factor SPN SPT16 subunit
MSYLKSSILHIYLFGYELNDIIMILTLKGDLHVFGAKKKIEFLQPAAEKLNRSLHLYVRNKADNNAENFRKLVQVIKQSNGASENAVVVGSFVKENNTTGIVAQWEQEILPSHDDIHLVDCTTGISHVMALKDEAELDLLKKSSVLSNKLMKHGCIPRLEDIINDSIKISHEEFAQQLEGIIEDPSQISLKIPKEDVSSCYFPIVQSGGKYDLKVSALSDGEALKFDIIIISMGARYRNYCSNITRTFLVDPPKAVSDMYELLLGMHEACRKVMRPGKPLRSVYSVATQYLEKQGREDLAAHLPKALGFGMGLDFRDATMALSAKNPATFKAGMVFTLSCCFQNLELSEKQRSSTPKESTVSWQRLRMSVLQVIR